MGRSGGGGGGGRSSGGFGGGRSSGGFSGGGRSSSRSSGSGYRGMSQGHIYSRHYYYGRGPRGPRNTSFGIMTTIIALVFIVVMFSVIFSASGSNVPKNTKQREPLQGVVKKTDWYQDDLHWVLSKNVMIEGLEDFYEETGIQPYIAFIPYQETLWNGNDLNVDKATTYMETLYDSKFKDEGHFIFAYFACQNDSRNEMEGQFRYLAGYAADSLMDNEAISILWGNFEKNYYDISLSVEEMISNTFTKTGESIMSKPTNGWDFAKIAMIALTVIIIIIAIVMVIKIKAKRAKEKEEYTKEILDKPLETFGEDTSDLEEKYKE